MTALMIYAANIAAILVLVFGLYFPRHRRRDLVVAFLAVALLADGLWSSHQARGRLRQQLPQLQQQLDTLQRQAVDIRALQAQPVNPTAPENALLQTATTLVRNAGLWAAGALLVLWLTVHWALS